MIASAIAALAGAWNQSTRVMRLHLPAGADLGADALMAEKLQAVEEISAFHDRNDIPEVDRAIAGYRLQLSCLSLNAGISLRKLLGQAVLVELDTDGAPRAFHGHVTDCRMEGANGGMARYVLTIEPWLAFLRHRRDSAVFQDMTVPEIIDSVFRDYQGQGRLQPAWRLDLQDASVYAKRSLATQYQETDLAFVNRLLAEEGLFYTIEHKGDASSASLGTHTVVIADHNGSFKPNARERIAFSQPGAVMPQDSIDRWRSVRRWQSNAVEILTWDYRQAAVREASSTSSGGDHANGSQGETPGGLLLTLRDAPGVYANENRAQAERQARNQLQAIEARNEIFTGTGTVRSLTPATTFTLTGHYDHVGGAEDHFVLLRVVHQAHNNLNADLKAEAMRLLGEATLDQDAVTSSLLDAALQPARGEARPVYRNRFEAIRSKVPYRPLVTDADGKLLHPKPVASGQQTAVVVGAQGQAVHTDRDNRIRVQFHWQRGERSHSGLSSPAPDGHVGAPANEQSGTWVRVLAGIAPTAGVNWGGQAVPRVGQEVLIDFIEGDIDRPVVIGTLYNGRGQDNAQGNQAGQGAGAATGNAPAWFPGDAEGHQHAAVLSGIKTQALGTSQSGGGAYNQLVFDDTPGQSRASLQQHADSHDGASELNLGLLRQQTDNQRLAATGQGFELKTRYSAAIRGGQGLLLSTEKSSGAQLDVRGALSQLADSVEKQKQLAETAQKHNAKFEGETEAGKLPAVESLAESVEVLKASATASAGSSGGDDGGEAGSSAATAFSAPQLQLSSPAGIAAATPASAILAAGVTSSVTAGKDINQIAQGNLHHLAKSGISLFTYGKASDASKPVQDAGMALHAASGKVIVQSQAGKTLMTAAKQVTVASVGQDVQITGKQHVQFSAQGAWLKLEGGNIEVHGPGAMEFKASAKELTGPASSTSSLTMSSGDIKGCSQASQDASAAMAGAQNL
ncbi:type VI secretion system Vgr family protein [Herbaspirillum sp. C7C8]|uniref:type VI secretion system Vgr family protein n=1 Tax=Herbaspirillum sp. C7C8 TaxID=2736665 RepID=UPI001F51C751|nr:type VI secretion system Vgr family protein [Herbaspirillum sp. C7C8]MCI1005925.1 type VI secretion system tip protein VgrG [Herbaspirillum sp. C7C8]